MTEININHRQTFQETAACDQTLKSSPSKEMAYEFFNKAEHIFHNQPSDIFKNKSKLTYRKLNASNKNIAEKNLNNADKTMKNNADKAKKNVNNEIKAIKNVNNADKVEKNVLNGKIKVKKNNVIDKIKGKKNVNIADEARKNVNIADKVKKTVNDQLKVKKTVNDQLKVKKTVNDQLKVKKTVNDQVKVKKTVNDQVKAKKKTINDYIPSNIYTRMKKYFPYKRKHVNKMEKYIQSTNEKCSSDSYPDTLMWRTNIYNEQDLLTKIDIIPEEQIKLQFETVTLSSSSLSSKKSIPSTSPKSGNQSHLRRTSEKYVNDLINKKIYKKSVNDKNKKYHKRLYDPFIRFLWRTKLFRPCLEKQQTTSQLSMPLDDTVTGYYDFNYTYKFPIENSGMQYDQMKGKIFKNESSAPQNPKSRIIYTIREKCKSVTIPKML